jgi:hypothetical protein
MNNTCFGRMRSLVRNGGAEVTMNIQTFPNMFPGTLHSLRHKQSNGSRGNNAIVLA